MAANCQIFTPKEYVEKLLDFAGYTDNIFGKKVIENSCGSGNILEEICVRYITDGLNKHKSLSEIKNGLEHDIIGYEIDDTLLDTCVMRLDSLALNYGIYGVSWNIHAFDFLKQVPQEASFVIANPPYITYKDMPMSDRQFLKEKFVSCKRGKFDYYYAFVEQGLKCMGPNATLVYVLPSSIYKNKSGHGLRELLKPVVTDIYDYSSEIKFKDIMTSSTVLVCKNGMNADIINYHNLILNTHLQIPKTLLGDKWFFTRNQYSGNKRLGDYCAITNSIATQCNEAFLITDYIDTGKGYLVDGLLLEKSLIYPACSPKSIRSKTKPLIIFPYEIDQKGSVIRIIEKDFQKKYPGIYAHLEKYKKKLLERASQKSAFWYEYGRSQAINHLFVPKIVLPSVLTNSVKSEIVNSDVIPYAGIFVYATKDMPIEKIDSILKSEALWNYLSVHSIDSGGKSIRVSVKEVQNYQFE